MAKKKILLLAAALILAAAAGGIYTLKYHSLPVESYEVVKRDVKEVIEETGKIELMNKQTVTTFQGGKVEKLQVTTGDPVKEGQILGWLGQRTAVLSQLAALEDAYELAENNYRYILTENPEYKTLKASLVQAEAAFDTAQREYDQNKLLFAAGAVSKDELTAAENDLNIARENLAAARSQVTGSRLQNIEKEALFNVVNAQTELTVMKKNLDDVQFIAELDGIVTRIVTEEGEPAPAGSTVLEIGKLEEKQVKAEVLAEKIKDLQVGQEIEIYGDLLGKGEILKGSIKIIAPQAVLTYSLLGAEEYRVPVWVNLAVEDERLIPGSQVDLNIIKESKKAVLVVDRDGVFTLNDADYVFVIKNGRAQLAKIQLGIKDEDLAEVVEGLELGDKIIINPPSELEPGQRVKV
ncbi:MAG: efflux RND transporter periplasmic adaptor subunit [Peptococcaceae bacterium]